MAFPFISSCFAGPLFPGNSLSSPNLGMGCRWRFCFLLTFPRGAEPIKSFIKKADIDRESSSMRQAQVSILLSHDCTEPSYPLPQWTQMEGGGCSSSWNAAGQNSLWGCLLQAGVPKWCLLFVASPRSPHLSPNLVCPRQPVLASPLTTMHFHPGSWSPR